MKETYLYWLAGILEGEGCFHITKPSEGRRAKWKTTHMNTSITLTSTDKDVVEKALFYAQIGKIYGPYNYNTTFSSSPYTKKLVWRWQVTKQSELKLFLVQLLPLMSQRRQDKIGELLLYLNEPKESHRFKKGNKFNKLRQVQIPEPFDFTV